MTNTKTRSRRKFTAENLEIMRLLDRQYAITPFYGQRRLQAWLAENGYPVNIKRLRHSVKQEYVYLNPCETGDELWRGLGTDTSASTTTGGFTRALDTRHPQAAISSKKRRLDA